MPIRFTWDDRLSVGHSTVDEQHRGLLELGNAIVDADLDEAPYFIDKLYEYARAHFEYEEEMMASVKYPELYHHKEIHNNMISELHGLSRRPLESEEEFREFKKFLYNWIIDHIMHEDRKYADFVGKLS